MLYIDTSSLLKLLWEEPESAAVRETIANAEDDMTKLKTSLLTAAITLGIGTPIALLKTTNDRLDSLKAAFKKSSRELAALNEENERLSKLAVAPEDLARFQKEHEELMRLRDEVASLRRENEATEQELSTKRSTSTDEPHAAEKSGGPDTPITTFTAEFNANLGRGESLTAGGWSVAPGRRGLFVVTPEVVNNRGLPGVAPNAANPTDQAEKAQVMIRTKFLDAPEELLVNLGLGQLLVDGTESTLGHALSAERTQALLEALKAVEGVSILSSPVVTTLDGRQAQITVQNTRTIYGEIYNVGPRVDLLPSVSADASSINLTVIAELNQLAKGIAP